MEPPGHQRSMTTYDTKIIFEFLTPQNRPWAFKNHLNVFYFALVTRNTLDVEIHKQPKLLSVVTHPTSSVLFYNIYGS